MSAMCMALGGWAPRRGLAYVGGIEVCLAASVWWVTQHWLEAIGVFEANLSNLVHINVVAIALAGIAWLQVEGRFVSRRTTAAGMGRWPAFHHAAAVLSTAAVALLAGVALYGAAIEEPPRGVAVISWLAWGAAVVLLIVCGWDRSFRPMSAGCYVLGLVGLVRVMAHAGMTSHALAWAMSAGLAGYVLVTTLIWRCWPSSDRGAPLRAETSPWLPLVNGVIALVSVLLAVFVSLTHPQIAWRMLIVVSPLLCAAFAVLAAGGARQSIMQTRAAALLATAAVLFAWSWVSPGAPTGVLHRAVGLVVALVVIGVAFAAATTRIAPDRSWATALATSIASSSVIAGAALLYCCGYEVWGLVNHLVVPLARPAVAALIVALALAILCCVLFATRDRFDPFRLKPSAKEAYVYLAEVLAAVLALHVRATMPWLFSGVIMRYWPMLVIALAFAATGAGETCERYGRRVLSRPLGRTSIFLPALALLEFFVVSSQVHFSIVLLTTGALYAVLAALRRSITLGVLAGLSVNGSLWYLLGHSPGLEITRHPQLWFIPPSLAVLVAGYLNRARLTEQQRKALNYACLLGVYLSSTADVFLIGVANAPWLPLVLAGLSVIGVLAGLASRVRSFLMLGTGFLCLSLLTMIWHAAADLGWTWVWYVAGIALGAAIITVFALFEKKRSEMTAWLEHVRTWVD
jgi:hypothetical protein